MWRVKLEGGGVAVGKEKGHKFRGGFRGGFRERGLASLGPHNAMGSRGVAPPHILHHPRILLPPAV